MVDRIRELLLIRQLTPTQFADAIGVARPIVSHIMSGRNKPSLEVVQKVLAAFPDLAMPWLLNGSGPMLAASSAPTAGPTVSESVPLAVASPPRKRPARFAPPVLLPQLPATPANEASGGSLGPAAEAPAGPPPALPQPQEQSSAAGAQALGQHSSPNGASASAGVAVSTTGIPPELALFAEPGKAIRRIVIFYRDGTFADYQPE